MDKSSKVKRKKALALLSRMAEGAKLTILFLVTEVQRERGYEYVLLSKEQVENILNGARMDVKAMSGDDYTLCYSKKRKAYCSMAWLHANSTNEYWTIDKQTWEELEVVEESPDQEVVKAILAEGLSKNAGFGRNINMNDGTEVVVTGIDITGVVDIIRTALLTTVGYKGKIVKAYDNATALLDNGFTYTLSCLDIVKAEESGDGYYTEESIAKEYEALSDSKKITILKEALDLMQSCNSQSVMRCIAEAMGYYNTIGAKDTYTKPKKGEGK